jgi:hypothetical protein
MLTEDVVVEARRVASLEREREVRDDFGVEGTEVSLGDVEMDSRK